MPQITIAAIEGTAVGASAALALACDWRVAAKNAAFYLPEAKVGLNMGWGAIPRLTSLIGPARTKRA
ncbi:enoyl-CoA hydratase/isomerase family protein, partial [Enterococcus faecium]|uniref:enoyl-CoA hydratase/isomerase family protein n=1 Tax=Enterococcus faecium TaxID=1352 RepID=UPI003F4429E0